MSENNANNQTTNNADDAANTAGQERVVNQTKTGRKPMTRGRKALWIGGGVAAVAAIGGGLFIALRKGNAAPLVEAVQHAGEVAAKAAG